MATDLMLPSGLAPSNLHLRPSVKATYIDGDMFAICERLAEVSPRLYLVQLTEADNAVWCVMEACDDGVQRSVGRYQDADARMIEDVQRMLRIPFEHRLAAREAEVDRQNAAEHEAIVDEIVEKIGHGFRRQLWHDGFIESRGKSYPTLGVASRGQRAR